MHRVNILASENTLFSTVFSSYDMLMQAGVFWNLLFNQKLTPYFKVMISSVDGKDVRNFSGASIRPHCKINNSDQYDIVIVPSEGMNIDPLNPHFRKRVEYLKRMHDKGALIASICTGAFVVASTGLLDDKIATTHWALEQKFNKLFPRVNLDTNLLIAENPKIITAGGVSADLDLSMKLITKFCGEEVALQTSRCTLVNHTNRNQAQFKMFVVEKKHGDETILKCQQFIEKNLTQKLSIAVLSEKFSMIERTLNRRFKKATGQSVNVYIQKLKIEKAKSILERSDTSFDEIAHELGYENVSFFRRKFKQQVGLTPKEYRKAFLLSPYQ